MIWLLIAILLGAASVGLLSALDPRRWKVWPAASARLGRSVIVAAGGALALAAALATAAIPQLDHWMTIIAFGCQFTLAALLYGLFAGCWPDRAHHLTGWCLGLAVILLIVRMLAPAGQF